MKYTVKRLAKMAGVSVRTLHYYDQIGLLKPEVSEHNGYRQYGEKELLKLQQILFFRELEFSLEKIKEIIDSQNFDIVDALQDQKNLLELKRKRLGNLVLTIDKTLDNLKGGESMSDDDKFSAFNDPTYQKYKDEVEERWGNSDAYKQSRERVSKMSKEDLERIKSEALDIRTSIAELMLKGLAIDSPEVQKQVDRFYNHLHNFYNPSNEMFKGLGQMYVDDPRFKEVYEGHAKGMAEFMRDAMVHYADTNLKA